MRPNSSTPWPPNTPTDQVALPQNVYTPKFATEPLQALREDPSLLPMAVEELLRYDAPVQVDGRTAREDLELGGRHIRKGQGVTVLIGSANHDPDVFPSPERLDITRKDTSNISFGRGIHHCLGAPLARLEGRIALAMLLERFAHLRLLTERPTFRDNVVLRGLRVLPIGATVQRTPWNPTHRVASMA